MEKKDEHFAGQILLLQKIVSCSKVCAKARLERQAPELRRSPENVF